MFVYFQNNVDRDEEDDQRQDHHSVAGPGKGESKDINVSLVVVVEEEKEYLGHTSLRSRGAPEDDIRDGVWPQSRSSLRVEVSVREIERIE